MLESEEESIRKTGAKRPATVVVDGVSTVTGDTDPVVDDAEAIDLGSLTSSPGPMPNES